ncbi:Imm72 family immunity protein [Aquabacterium sp.]|uniref:Imm72 family immunity protein n=1 Tax=Aquabacterium sp. TaxID=1872578 RepID=UPI0019CD0C95|nr:Imm72 family immunity protein [Aquabacterium sp.]MBC7700398.1 hypothetical protein [Aquabacterium sp.]
MLNPKIMTQAQQEEARAKAFHLLKKYTSLTFLEHAVEFYRQFLKAYAQQLDTPRVNQKWYEEKYIYSFLPELAEMEQGLEILRKGTGKEAAYKSIVSGSNDFPLFGRASEELGVYRDPFFMALGARELSDSNQEELVGFVKQCFWAMLCIECLQCSVQFDFEEPLTATVTESGDMEFFSRWTYESLFQLPHPVHHDIRWPPARAYPPYLPPCPSKNEHAEGQILSGKEIPIDGIYEPWFLFTSVVGCPNYFLKGQIAHQYQPEGENELIDVRWRLIWQDTRYLNGTVPAEEAQYILSPPEDAAPNRYAQSAYAGDLCPQTGQWQAPRLQNRIELVERGQPMPGQTSTQTGTVIWYLMNAANGA